MCLFRSHATSLSSCARCRMRVLSLAICLLSSAFLQTASISNNNPGSRAAKASKFIIVMGHLVRLFEVDKIYLGECTWPAIAMDSFVTGQLESRSDDESPAMGLSSH